MAIDPRGADLKRYLAEDPGGPVVMLNLLRFAEGGRESYFRYAEALRTTFLPRYGAEVLYAGDGSTTLVAESGQDWDAVLLVRYPSREAFSAMVADPEYQEVTAWRTGASPRRCCRRRSPGEDQRPGRTAPGFIRPAGSSRSLSARIRSSSTAPL